MQEKYLMTQIGILNEALKNLQVSVNALSISETNDNGGGAGAEGAGAEGAGGGLPTDAAHYFEHVFTQGDCCAKNKTQSIAHNLGSLPRWVLIKCLIVDATKLYTAANQHGPTKFVDGMETEFVSVYRSNPDQWASVNVTADTTHIYYVVSKDGPYLNYLGEAATGDHHVRSISHPGSNGAAQNGACHVVVRAWK
tara:strand:+ start:1922 stop:2506 length:585 start_codon:yes stop_codon:yes gene_type:complete